MKPRVEEPGGHGEQEVRAGALVIVSTAQLSHIVEPFDDEYVPGEHAERIPK